MSNRRYLGRSTIASFVLHAAILILLSLGGSGGSPGDGSSKDPSQQESKSGSIDNPITVEIVDKIADADESKESSDKDGLEQMAPHINDPCVDSFGGIGITENLGFDQDVIVKVHKGYPAEKAGIQVGDEVMNRGEIIGEVGTHVIVRIVRNGVVLEFDMIRDKICTKEKIDKGVTP